MVLPNEKIVCETLREWETKAQDTESKTERVLSKSVFSAFMGGWLAGWRSEELT